MLLAPALTIHFTRFDPVSMQQEWWSCTDKKVVKRFSRITPKTDLYPEDYSGGSMGTSEAEFILVGKNRSSSYRLVSIFADGDRTWTEFAGSGTPQLRLSSDRHYLIVVLGEKQSTVFQIQKNELSFWATKSGKVIDVANGIPIRATDPLDSTHMKLMNVALNSPHPPAIPPWQPAFRAISSPLIAPGWTAWFEHERTLDYTGSHQMDTYLATSRLVTATGKTWNWRDSEDGFKGAYFSNGSHFRFYWSKPFEFGVKNLRKRNAGVYELNLSTGNLKSILPRSLSLKRILSTGFTLVAP